MCRAAIQQNYPALYVDEETQILKEIAQANTNYRPCDPDCQRVIFQPILHFFVSI